jgi:hypothetical protein
MLSPEVNKESKCSVGEGGGVCKRLRMKFSVGCLQCRPAEASRCYEFNRQTRDVLNQTFEQRDALGFHNEHSDERLKLKQQDHTIRNSRNQARLCSMLMGEEDE